MNKHSNVYYVFDKIKGFEAVEKARAYKNDLGLDLFTYNRCVYEGRSGLKLIKDSPSALFERLKNPENLNKFNETTQRFIDQYGLSPRYTRPDELKKDIFIKPEKDENIILSQDINGAKHYYQRCYNENDTELFTLKNATDIHRTVYVQCEGYMVDVGNHNGLDYILERLSNFNTGIKGEIERIFNEDIENPNRIADLGAARILNRYDEAMAHNEPIIQARKEKYEHETATREAKALAEEQARKAEYKKAINAAEDNIINRKQVDNSDVDGDKSLIMQLFREHNISVPLKTQGWIINSLCDIHFIEKRNEWSYGYYGNDSTVFSKYLPKLISIVQEKQKISEKQKPSILNQLETAKETVAKSSYSNEKQAVDTAKKRESELN